MTRKHLPIFLLFLWILAACQPSPEQAAARGAQAFIDDPKDGASLPQGPVRINVHAEGAAGLATVEISVNGQTIQTSSLKGETTRNSAYTSTVWTPSQPGRYEIGASATDLSGAKGPVAHISVTISGPSANAAGASSSVQPTAALDPAFVSTLPATPNTATPTAHTSLPVGAPTVASASNPVTPAPTPTARLAGAITPAGHLSPMLEAPIKTDLVPCAPVTFTWNAPSDIKAVKYDVELQKIVGRDPVIVKTWDSLADTHVSFTPECNILYRWRARGVDSAGSALEWSDYEEFRSGPPTAK